MKQNALSSKTNFKFFITTIYLSFDTFSRTPFSARSVRLSELIKSIFNGILKFFILFFLKF